MELKLLNEQGQSTAKVQASDEIFAREYNEALIHQVVVAYQANARTANRAQKDRSEVSYSTKKPWRQKGTGNARAGMRSSPIWRHGGRVHPNKPDENFSHKLNKKMYRAGMRSILSQLVREDRLHVVESFTFDSPKTKQAAQRIKSMGIDGSVMIITDKLDENTLLATRNLPHVWVVKPRQVDPFSLVGYQNVLITQEAVASLEELLG